MEVAEVVCRRDLLFNLLHNIIPYVYLKAKHSKPGRSFITVVKYAIYLQEYTDYLIQKDTCIGA